MKKSEKTLPVVYNEYRARLEILSNSDQDESRYIIFDKGMVNSVDRLVEHFDTREIKLTFTDGIRLRLVRDGDAKPGQNIDTYA